ncbi:hypothetical protein BX666DRAFT_1420448 [Dichotomocladium elegans]|nr:hypothetical protein BX666DRAFT_1420448 [Dichotomocladium elegans]
MPSPALSDSQFGRHWAHWQPNHSAHTQSAGPDREKSGPNVPGGSDCIEPTHNSSLKGAQTVLRRKSTKEKMYPAITTSNSDTSKSISREAPGATNWVDNAISGDQSRRRRKSLFGTLGKVGGGNSSQQQQHRMQPTPTRSRSMFGRTKTGKAGANVVLPTAISSKATPAPTADLLAFEDPNRQHYYYNLAETTSSHPTNSSPSSSLDDQQLSSDSGISKVSTFDSAATSAVSSTQAWLNAKPTPSIRRRQSALGCPGREQSIANPNKDKAIACIRPKAKSLRERRPSLKAPPKASDDESRAKVNSSNTRAPRTRSRVLRSPPPPPSSTDKATPPSLPNVDVQQIKDEIDPRSHHSDGSSQYHHRQKSVQNPADPALTANIINNVKRKLSIGKDRRTKNITPVDSDRKSLPANFASLNHQYQKKNLSNPSGLDVPIASEAKNVPYTITSPERQQQSYMRPTISFGQRLQPESNTSSSGFSRYKLPKEDMLLVQDNDRQMRGNIPPVPPVPKHHSIVSNDKSKLNQPHYANRSSSSGSSVHGILSNDEPYNEPSPVVQTTLQRQASYPSSFADTEDSDNNSSIRSGKSDNEKMNSNKSKAQTSAQNAPPRGLQSPSSVRKYLENSNSDITYQAMEDYYLGKTDTFYSDNKAAVPTRRRGKTLPGSLATPPPVPAVLMPPMKLEPIKLEIPESRALRAPAKSPYGQKSLTPTRIPILRPNLSSSVSSTPINPGGMSSEEDIIVTDGTTKTRRRKPEYRLSNQHRASLNKSTESTSSSTRASPKGRPRYTKATH